MNKWLFGKFCPVIKAVSGGCNLRCGYCFYAGSQPKIRLMPLETLQVVMSRCLEVAPIVQPIWHGGEPILAGMDFYMRVLELENLLCKPNQQIRNSIQTNGTLIDEEWAIFFRDNHFGVGVSLDGPPHLHNHTRIDASGRGSYDQVLRGINILRDVGLPISLITVINSLTLAYPAEIFWHMRQLGLGYSINNCTAERNAPEEVRRLAISSMRYAEFLIETLQLWLKLDDPSFRIRPLEDLVKAVLGRQPRLCKYQGNCVRYLTIGHDGNVYPCDGFLNETYCFGNLHNLTFSEILQQPSVQEYYSGRYKMRSVCNDCKWYNVCKGGCMREWDGNTYVADPTQHEFCGARKFLFSQVTEKLAKLGYRKEEVHDELVD